MTNGTKGSMPYRGRNLFNERLSEISREAYNFIIQGSCADMEGTPNKNHSEPNMSTDSEPNMRKIYIFFKEELE